MTTLRHALRLLWTHKSFTAAAVVTLAVGLGANTALFGLINMAQRPLQVPDPDRIVSIAADVEGDESGGFQYTFSLDALDDLQRRATSFSHVFGVMARIGGISTAGKPSQFFFVAASHNYFAGLGVEPHLGTLFDRASGSPASVVLGHTFWMRQFGGDPSIIGRQVRVNGHAAVVTGVVPRTFTGTFYAVELDGYIAIDDLRVVEPDVNRWLYHNRKARPIQVFGRLQPGVSAATAGTELSGLLESLGREHPATDAGIRARVVPEPLARPLPMRAVSEALPLVRFLALTIAALVLLIACLNVANLLLVRASGRERELAVRSALGASRARLVRQMVVEGLALSTLGGAAGFAVGHWASKLLIARIDLGADLPFSLDVAFDVRVFLASLAAATLSGVLISLWPAWRASRADARGALYDGRSQSSGVERQRVRRILVVGQIAGSLTLLAIAGVFVQSLVAAERIDLGFDADHLVTVRLDPRQVAYDEERTDVFYKDLLRRVRGWSDVSAASLAFSVPMSYLSSGGAIYIEGQPLPANGQPPATFLNHVGHGYFDTMRIPILRGRAFTEDDEREHSTTRRYAIVNETMAARFWPGENPIGKKLRVYGPAEPLLEVVGLARDSKYVVVFEQPRPFLYLPNERDGTLRTLHVRAQGDPAALAPRLERLIAELHPDLPIADLRPASRSLSGIFGFFLFRIGAVQAAGMGIAGLTLALVGVYGVVSFGARMRTREIGIRMALGAEPRDVLRLILRQGVLLVLAGLAVGLAVAAAITTMIASVLPLARPAWLPSLALALALGALAMWACYIPARRATRVPAMTALRHE